MEWMVRDGVWNGQNGNGNEGVTAWKDGWKEWWNGMEVAPRRGVILTWPRQPSRIGSTSTATRWWRTAAGPAVE